MKSPKGKVELLSIIELSKLRYSLLKFLQVLKFKMKSSIKIFSCRENRFFFECRRIIMSEFMKVVEERFAKFNYRRVISVSHFLESFANYQALELVKKVSSIRRSYERIFD